MECSSPSPSPSPPPSNSGHNSSKRRTSPSKIRAIMAKKGKSIADEQSAFIGGTIAVPKSVDPMDISCRSDLTQDLVPDDCGGGGLLFAGHSRRAAGQRQPPHAALRRDVHVTGPSQSTFHAGNEEPLEDLEELEFPEDSDSVARELDAQAEAAARCAFGDMADKVDGPKRRSTLVSENATIDVSWFAARGLMSRRSFERYQEEMKSNVITSASSKNNLRRRGGRKKSARRASISMGDLRNQDWETIVKVDTDEAPPMSAKENVEAPFKTLKIPTKPRSVDEGMDQLVNTVITTQKSDDEEPDSAEQGLDKLVESLLDVFKNDQDDTASLIKSKLKGNAAKSRKQNNKSPTSGLNSDEIEVLAKMMRRLSRDQDESPYQDDDDETRSIQNEVLEGGIKRDCSSDDLMDSSTWENQPVHNEQANVTSDNSANPISSKGSTRESAILRHARESTKEAVDEVIREVTAQRRDSFKSVNTHKAGNGSTEKSSDLAGRYYAPKRISSAELKGLRVREVEFDSSLRSEADDSFHTSKLDRSETLSSVKSISGVLVPTVRKKSEERNNSDSSTWTLERGDTVSTLGSNSPHKKSDERSDVVSVMSKSPKEEREELQCNNASGLTMPRLDRGISATTQGAVTSAEFGKDDSISTRCSIPYNKDSKGRNLPRPSRQFKRSETNETARAVASIHDEMDRFDKSDGVDMTCGSNNFPARRSAVDACRPPRRRSISSHSSSGSGVMMRRNSFSSLFTAPTDLDDLEGPPLKEACGDILQEGMEYLAMSMLVNVYAKLRELSTLGHASVKLADIDVNSHQSLARRKEMKRLGLLKSEHSPYLECTKTAGAIVRTVCDEYEMLEASTDLSFRGTSQATMEYDAGLLSEFKTWVEESKAKQLDGVTEEVIRKLREECSRRQIMIKERGSSDSLNTMEQANAHVNVGRSIARRRGSLIAKSESFQDATWLEQERALIADHFGIGRKAVPSSRNDDARADSRRISRGVLTDSMIERTLEKSHEYFEEGSSMRNLLEAGLEVVWFADRHPDDVIYCICVNRETVTVTVVFRGQEGFLDLIKDSSSSSYPNPLLHEDYEGNSELINLRSAVSDDMLRVRRDTKKSTLDEIRQKVHEIGSELSEGGRYHLSVAGHSLGGGLATVAGLYLASDPSLDLASAVRVFTFASPRVGCEAFMQGYRHLEQTGRLVHARFANSDEIRSRLPMSSGYHHVGMQIRLHKANSAGRQRARQSLDVSYGGNDSRLADAFHLARNFFAAAKSSRISEYQHRMHFAREYRLALGDGVLRFDKRRRDLKSLNDYYLMKCRLSDVMGLAKEGAQLPSFFIFFLVSCLISFEIALLFKFVATW